MIGNYRVWKSMEQPKDWVENWVYINEACGGFCGVLNPSSPLLKSFLAESEGGMQGIHCTAMHL